MNDLEKQSLLSLKGKVITVYLSNGKAISGRLLEYDEGTLQLSGRTENDPPSFIKLKHVTTYHAGKTARKTHNGLD